MAHVVSVWATAIQVIFVWELILWIEHFVDVHYATTLIKVLHGLFVLSSIYVHHTAIEVVIFLVEDVFLVVVRFFCLLLVSFVIRYVCPLSSVGTCLQLLVELDNVILIKITYIFELVFFLIVVGLLNTEAEVISLLLTLPHSTILLFSSADRAYLISFCPVGAWNHLRVLMRDA